MFYYRRHFGIKVCDIWYEIPQKGMLKRCPIRSYSCMKQPFSGEEGKYLIYKRDALTLVNDLNKSEESIFGNFANTVRNEIHRAVREGVNCNWWNFEDIINNKQLVKCLNNEYLTMYKSKKIDINPIGKEIMLLAREGAVAISTAHLAGSDNSVAYHVYLLCGNVARLMYSVTPFREFQDKGVRNSISRANRRLHWEDIKYLKSQGYSTYDWGGYSKDKALENINAFKEGFGGTKEERFFYKVTSSLLVKKLYSIR